MTGLLLAAAAPANADSTPVTAWRCWYNAPDHEPGVAELDEAFDPVLAAAD